MRTKIELTLAGIGAAAWMAVTALFLAQVLTAPPVYLDTSGSDNALRHATAAATSDGGGEG